jgi:hypothetical protein
MTFCGRRHPADVCREPLSRWPATPLPVSAVRSLAARDTPGAGSRDRAAIARVRRRSHRTAMGDDRLISIGNNRCYLLVIRVTSHFVNQPPVFSAKCCAAQGPFWHS